MKKIILKSLLVISLISVMFTGCSNKKEMISKEYNDLELKDAPQWVLMPEVKGYIAEVGSAALNEAKDISFQREEAMAGARANMVKQIEIKVDTMFKSFKAATGSGKDSTFDKSSESVSKQLATRTLNGSIVKETWISRSGTMYVLMIVDTKSVSSQMETSIKTSFKNDKALYQKFLASKAQGELEQELEKHDK